MSYRELAVAIDKHISRREILARQVNNLSFDQFEVIRNEDIDALASNLLGAFDKLTL